MQNFEKPFYSVSKHSNKYILSKSQINLYGSLGWASINQHTCDCIRLFNFVYNKFALDRVVQGPTNMGRNNSILNSTYTYNEHTIYEVPPFPINL